jgi:hypothetical protein
MSFSQQNARDNDLHRLESSFMYSQLFKHILINNRVRYKKLAMTSPNTYVRNMLTVMHNLKLSTGLKENIVKGTRSGGILINILFMRLSIDVFGY